jgi:hypothetical protein
MPFRRVPIPQSQKNQVRQVSRRAWLESACDLDVSQLLVADRLHRAIGSKWLNEGVLLSDELLGHWQEMGIVEPASVYQRGEPGTSDEWDEG